MENLLESMGISLHLRAIRHLAIRTRSRPQTADLAGDVNDQRKRLQTKHEVWLDAREQRICATNEVYYQDEELDLEMSRLARVVLLITDGDTHHPLYKSLFPAAPSTLMAERGGPNQRLFVTTIIDSLRTDAKLAKVAHRADPLAARLEKLDRALAVRDELYIPENQAANKLEIELDNARRVYRTCFHRLNIIFPDKPNLVESFFPRLNRRASKAATADDTADATVTDTADATSPIA